MQGFGSERRVRPDVEGGPVAPAPMFRDPGVDPLAGQEQPRPGPEIRGRIAEALAPTVPGDHLPIENEAPAERLERPRQIAFGERIADRGRRHRPAVDLDERHGLGGQAERGAEVGQRRHRPARFEAEREVRPHRGVHGVHAAHQRLRNEGLGRDQREVPVERQHDQHVDPGGLDQRRLARNGREQARLIAGRQHLARMPVERDRDASDATRRRLLDHAAEDRLVSEMDAVEEPDSHHASCVVERERLDAMEDLHRRQASRTTSRGPGLPSRRGGRIEGRRGRRASVRGGPARRASATVG